MPKIYLFIVFMLSSVALNAQVCIPDSTNLSDSVIIDPLPYQDTVPGSGIQQKACLNTPYEQVFSVFIPSSITVPGIGGLKLISAILTGIDGLPSGLNYYCSNDDCLYNKDEFGCFVIKGTVTGVSAGDYPITLRFKVKAEVLGDINFTFPNAQLAPGTYTITVLPENSTECTASNQVLIEPDIKTAFSQVDDCLQFSFICEKPENIRFALYDVSGRMVYSQKKELTPGKNVLLLKDKLPAGIYVYQISGMSRNNSFKILIH